MSTRIISSVPNFITNGVDIMVFEVLDLFHYIPPTAKRGDIVKRLLNTCIAHSNSADLLLSNNASDWLSRDLTIKTNKKCRSYDEIN